MATKETQIVTPKILADKLGIKAKVLRSYLRKEFPRSAEEKNTSWTLSTEQVKAATAKFSKKDSEAK